MIGDDVDNYVTGNGGDDRKLGLPPRIVDVLRQMSPYADRLTWTVAEDSATVSLSLVWDLRSSSAAARRRRWIGPAAEQDPGDVGLLRKLKRRLDRPAANARASGGDDEPPSTTARGRGILRRCVTSLTALRLWKATHQSQSSPSLSTDRLDAKQRQHHHRQRQHAAGDDDELFCRSSRFTSVQVSIIVVVSVILHLNGQKDDRCVRSLVLIAS